MFDIHKIPAHSNAGQLWLLIGRSCLLGACSPTLTDAAILSSIFAHKGLSGSIEKQGVHEYLKAR